MSFAFRRRLREAAVVPDKYGNRKGQDWHPSFVEYIEFIARHPTYHGMPDAFREDGGVQWEAPSNRASGKFRETHGKRLEWWRRKAAEVGISTSSRQWISETAKKIHPLGKKPCKRCGRVLQLAYVYPRKAFFKRLERLGIPTDADSLTPLQEIAQQLIEAHGDRAIPLLTKALEHTGWTPPADNLDAVGWERWLTETYVPSESSLFSPGAMSNAPDRFDGFHSFNLCCRSSADRGRASENLRSYVTDRRVFEYWNDGDWIAADRMVGQLRSVSTGAQCANIHDGPVSADHIGPLSLGFTHRPEFQMLCRPCNSGKNNRLSLSDVHLLLEAERRGDTVISWWAKEVWDSRKTFVNDDESALRLSKMLRDNRHTFMYIMKRFLDEGRGVFLTTLLHLERAAYDVEFEELRIAERGITGFLRERRTNREGSYLREQQGRRLRVAFAALKSYVERPTRNALFVLPPEAEAALARALRTLARDNSYRRLEAQLQAVLRGGTERHFEALAAQVTNFERPPSFATALMEFEAVMRAVGGRIAARWNDERYVRAAADED